MLCPAAALEGAVNANTDRSGPTVSARQVVLLVSEDSGTPFSPSALTIRYQVPVVVFAGMVSVAAPALLAPAASAGTLRPPSARSPASSVLLLDRKYCVTEVSAGPPPWLRMVSVALIVCPAAAVVGN